MKKVCRKVFSVLVAIVFIFTSSVSVFGAYWEDSGYGIEEGSSSTTTNRYGAYNSEGVFIPEVSISNCYIDNPIFTDQPYNISVQIKNSEHIKVTLQYTITYNRKIISENKMVSEDIGPITEVTTDNGKHYFPKQTADHIAGRKLLSIRVQCQIIDVEKPGTYTYWGGFANGAQSDIFDVDAIGYDIEANPGTIQYKFASLSDMHLSPKGSNKLEAGKPFTAKAYVNVNDAGTVTVRFDTYINYKNINSGEVKVEKLDSRYDVKDTNSYADATFDGINSKQGYKIDNVRISCEITKVSSGEKKEPYLDFIDISSSNIIESGITVKQESDGKQNQTNSQPAAGSQTQNPSSSTNQSSATSSSGTITEARDFNAKDVFKGNVYSQLIVDGPIPDSINVTKDGKTVTLKKSNAEILNRKDHNPPIAGPNAGETVTSEYTVRATYTGTASSGGTQTGNNNNQQSQQAQQSQPGTTTKTETIKTENFAEIAAVVPTSTLQIGQEYDVTIKVKNATAFPVNVAYEQLLYSNSGSKKGWERGMLTFDSNSEKTVKLRVPYSADYKKTGLRLAVDKDAKSTSVNDYKVSQKFNEWYTWDGSKWNSAGSENRFSKVHDFIYYNKSSHANVLTKVPGSEAVTRAEKAPKSKGKYVGEKTYVVGTAQIKYSGTAYKANFNKNSVELAPIDVTVPTVTLTDAKIESSAVEYGKTYEASVKVNNPEGSVTKLTFTPIYVIYKDGKVTESRQSSIQAAATGADQVVKVTLPEMKNKNANQVKVEAKVNKHEYFNKNADARRLDMALTPSEAVSNETTAETKDSEVSLESAEIVDSKVRLESGCSVRVDLNNEDKRHVVLNYTPKYNVDGQTVSAGTRKVVTNKNGSFTLRLNDIKAAGLGNDFDNTTLKVEVSINDSNDITTPNAQVETANEAVSTTSQWQKLDGSTVTSGEWTKISAGVTTTTQEVVVNNPVQTNENQQQNNTQQPDQQQQNNTSNTEKKVSISELTFEPVTQGKEYKTKVYLNNQSGADSVTLKYTMKIEFKKPSGSPLTYNPSPETVVKSNKFDGWVETTLYAARDYDDYSVSKVTIICSIDKVVGGEKASSSTSLTESKEYNTTQPPTDNSNKKVSLSSMSIVGGTIKVGSPFTVRVYLNNNDKVDSLKIKYSIDVQYKSGATDRVENTNPYSGSLAYSMYKDNNMTIKSRSNDPVTKAVIKCELLDIVGGIRASENYENKIEVTSFDQPSVVDDSDKKVSISSLSFEPITQGKSYKTKVYLNNQKGAESVTLEYSMSIEFKKPSGSPITYKPSSETVVKNNKYDGWVETTLYAARDYDGYSVSKVTITCKIDKVLGGVKASSGTSITESKDYQVATTQTPKQEVFNPTTSTPPKPADQIRKVTVSEKYRWTGSKWEYAGQTDSVSQTIEYGGWILKKTNAKVLTETIRAATWPDRTYYPNPGGSTGAIEYPTKYEVEVTYTADRVK